MTIGITGGSGAGKSTLLAVLAEYDCEVVDCDKVYHSLLRTNAAMLAELREAFPAAFDVSGALNRKALGAIVFSDADKRETLNAITHRYVSAEVTRITETTQKRTIAVDAIALFESGRAERCDITVAVTAPLSVRVSRIMSRDGVSYAYAMSRIASQHDDAWFAERADVTLVNDGDASAFTAKCRAWAEQCITGNL